MYKNEDVSSESSHSEDVGECGSSFSAGNEFKHLVGFQ